MSWCRTPEIMAPYFLVPTVVGIVVVFTTASHIGWWLALAAAHAAAIVAYWLTGRALTWWWGRGTEDPRSSKGQVR